MERPKIKIKISKMSVVFRWCVFFVGVFAFFLFDTPPPPTHHHQQREEEKEEEEEEEEEEEAPNFYL